MSELVGDGESRGRRVSHALVDVDDRTFARTHEVAPRGARVAMKNHRAVPRGDRLDMEVARTAHVGVDEDPSSGGDRDR